MPTAKKLNRKVKTSSLIIGIIVILAFSLFIGIIGIAQGIGSGFPQLNLIAKPFVCGGGEMSHVQHVTEIGDETYYSATWSCTSERSGLTSELDSSLIFRYAGTIYGLALFAVVLGITYFYWHSDVGPAKNDGLELW